MLMAIATKTGLAAGVNITTLRPYVQDGLLLSSPPRPPTAAAAAAAASAGTSTPTAAAAGAEATATAEGVDESEVAVVQHEEELSQEAKAEIKTAVMLVSCRAES